MKAAVIGAGIAGLRLARILNAEGLDVHVFEKARGPSGRLATRRNETGQFDHGAQYFTARSPSFLQQVEEWNGRGVVEPWGAKVVHLEGGLSRREDDSPVRYVGAPRMSAVARDLSEGLAAEFSTRVSSVKRTGREWSLEIDEKEEREGFDLVLLAVPAPQAVPLLLLNPVLARRAGEVHMLPCHALMVQLETELDVNFDAAFVESPSLSWVANNASKPGRMPGHSWILHSTADWSQSHLETPVEVIRDELLEAFSSATESVIPAANFFAVHRWLYARSGGGLDGEPLWDPDMGIGACGDWIQGDRVEDAYLSADALASEILNR